MVAFHDHLLTVPIHRQLVTCAHRFLSPQLSSEHMTAIPSRNVAHPALPVLAAATNSGRIHAFR